MPAVIPPVPDSDDEFFWDGVSQGQLLLRCCADCGRLQHPPSPMCPACHSVKWTTREASGESDGFDFRVAGKGFVWSYPERRPGKPRLIRTDIAVLFVGDEAEKQALLLSEPEVFFTTPEYDTWPLVMLRLAQVEVERLRELVTDAWRMRAPDRFVGE